MRKKILGAGLITRWDGDLLPSFAIFLPTARCVTLTFIWAEMLSDEAESFSHRADPVMGHCRFGMRHQHFRAPFPAVYRKRPSKWLASPCEIFCLKTLVSACHSRAIYSFRSFRTLLLSWYWQWVGQR